MGWKEWPSWLKGGIIALIIPIVSIIAMIGSLLDLDFLDSLGFMPYWILFAVLPFKFGYETCLISLPGCIPNVPLIFTIAMVILFFLSFFLIGAIIGFIIGKIKSIKIVG